MSNDKEKMHQVEKHETERPPSEELSRHGDADEKNLPLGKAIRRYPKITGYSFAITLGILLWGFDLVIVGTVSSIPAFQ